MGFFPSFFFLSVLRVTNTFVLHVNGSCDVHGVRGVTTTVCDVMMMYCKERYMENVPSHRGCYRQQRQELRTPPSSGWGDRPAQPFLHLGSSLHTGDCV